MSIITTLGRAFTSNLRTISVDSGEQSKLVAAAIQEPTLQRYFVWRRSLAMMVVLTTFLSAGLATYCELTETGDRLSGVQTRLENLLEDAKADILPDPGEEDESDEEPSGDEATVDKSPSKSKPASDATEEKAAEQEPTTAFGQFADGVHLLSLYAMPLAAMAVLLWWTRLTRTFQILLTGFALAFFVPILLALCPWSWWGYVKPHVSPEKVPAQYFESLAESTLEGVFYLVTLLPTVLSLVPGAQRACLRVKTLLPESMLPGWFLVAAAPFYALFLLVIFVAVNQIASDLIFVIGMFLFLAAPFIYVARAEVFVRPLMSDEDFYQMRRVQRMVGAVTVLAGLLLIGYLATQEIMAVRLVNFDEKASVFRPIELVVFLLELIGRSMFMTLLGADLFIRMNLAAWKHGLTLEGTPAEAHYHRVMGALEQVAK